MSKSKNALRQHFIAPWKKGDTTAPSTGEAFLPLAKWIATVSDASDEDTSDDGYYDGDGTPEKVVNSVTLGYSFEGSYDNEDPAQKMVADMRTKVGDDRKVWFKVISAAGDETWTGVAVVSEIVAGDGDATEWEAFKATVTYIKNPTITKSTTPAA